MMKKTLIIIVTRQLQIPSLQDLTLESKKLANFILIINKKIFTNISEDILKIFQKIYPVNVINDGRLDCHINSEVIRALDDITTCYGNLYAFVPDERNLDEMEAILKKYNIPRWNKNTAKLCRNKILMKSHMKNHGIRIPRYIEYDINLSFEFLSLNLGLPFILKPVCGSGSFGVHKINDATAYTYFLENYLNNTPYEAEEFIDGILYHIDTVKYENKIFVTIGEYTYPMAESKNGKIQGSIEILEENPNYHNLRVFNEAVISSLNNDGCFHHEVFISLSNEIIFLEIAWRPAGPPVSNIFKQHYGIEQNLLFIALHLGYNSLNIKCNALKTVDSEYTVEYFIPKCIGQYNGLILPNLNGIVTIQHLVEMGTILTQPALSYSDSCAKLAIKYFGNYKDKSRQDFEILKHSNLMK